MADSSGKTRSEIMDFLGSPWICAPHRSTHLPFVRSTWISSNWLMHLGNLYAPLRDLTTSLTEIVLSWRTSCARHQTLHTGCMLTSLKVQTRSETWLERGRASIIRSPSFAGLNIPQSADQVLTETLGSLSSQNKSLRIAQIRTKDDCRSRTASHKQRNDRFVECSVNIL